MTHENDKSASSLLNAKAVSLNMPSPQQPATNGTEKSSTGPEATTNGEPKGAKSARPQMSVGAKTAENIAEAGAGVKLTAAELKKRKTEEKKARRADKVTEKGAQAQAEATQAPSTATKSQPQRQPTQSKEGLHHERTGSNKPLPTRPKEGPTPVSEKPQDTKRLPMFAHLYPKQERASLSTASREVHPAVLTLALQLRDHIICGSTARLAAMLLAFTAVIRSYSVPTGTTISRHLITHLGHQIGYLSSARPLSIGQGNAIRWLKRLISTIDPSLAESEAKAFIISSIEAFIREKVVLAHEVISTQGAERIEDGDVVCTFGKSSVVERTLVQAHKSGKRFRVIVVDSRPMFEGRNLARNFVKQGMEVQYCMISALADVVGDVTKCFIGASAMLGNGRLSSRCGTAMVALMVKACAPQASVVVLCESVKFTNRVALDAIVMNELGEADALVEVERDEVVMSEVTPVQAPQKGKKGKDEDAEDDDTRKRGLEGWRDQPNLHLLNLKYDITPAEHIDMVISELGSLPPTAVPVVNGPGGDE